MAEGATGMVIGEHARILVQFPPDAQELMYRWAVDQQSAGRV